MQHRKLRLHGCSYQKEGSSIDFSTAKGNLDREQEMEDTILDLIQTFTEGLEERYAPSSTPTAEGDPTHVVEEQSLDDKLLWVVTDAGGDTLAKIPRVRKESTVPNQEEITTFSLILRKIPLVKSDVRQRQHEPSVG